jgi:hypothetical protein
MIIAGMDSQLERYIILIRFCFFLKKLLWLVLLRLVTERIYGEEKICSCFYGIGLVAGKRGGNEILEFDFFLLVLTCLVIEKMVGRK